ncbi:hypothetical protein HanRHA438_Chr00c27g0854211 [Helianthus annuus]|nr:hypothetical protein HanRHA438_Chr00c27g0854211 [Helianthus annuus]
MVPMLSWLCTFPFKMTLFTAVEALDSLLIEPILGVFLAFQAGSARSLHEILCPPYSTCKGPFDIHQIHLLFINLLIVFLCQIDVPNLTFY